MTTAQIRVPDIGSVPVVKEGLAIPLLHGSEYLYEVTSSQAQKWNKLTGKQKPKLVKKADQEKKDLREVL